MTTPFTPDIVGQEVRASLWLALSVLIVLTVAKSVSQVAYLGPACLTFAAFWQLRAPLWRVERHHGGFAALGLRFDMWRLDARGALVLALVILPVYAAAYHVWVVYGPQWCAPLGLGAWAPRMGAQLQWRVPADAAAMGTALMWFGERTLTHTLGVALPEELFYRGYLQPLWQSFWPARCRIAQAPFGWATVAACGVFALGHFLGEWHLGRLGPFLPSLLFAWQRAQSGTIVGAVGLHAACNLFAEVWSRQYVLGPTPL